MEVSPLLRQISSFPCSLVWIWLKGFTLVTVSVTFYQAMVGTVKWCLLQMFSSINLAPTPSQACCSTAAFLRPAALLTKQPCSYRPCTPSSQVCVLNYSTDMALIRFIKWHLSWRVRCPLLSLNLKLESWAVRKDFLCGLPRHWALLDRCLLTPSQVPFHDIPSFLPGSQLSKDSLVLTRILSFSHLLLWVVFFSPLDETPSMCFCLSHLTLLLASRFVCPVGVSTPLLGSLTHSVSRKKFASVSLFCSSTSLWPIYSSKLQLCIGYYPPNFFLLPSS